MVDRNNSDRIEEILRAKKASILLQSSISQSNGYCASLIYAGKTELLRMIKIFVMKNQITRVLPCLRQPQCWILMPFQSDTNVYRDQASRWCFNIFAPVIAAAFLNGPKHLRYIQWYP